METKTLGERSHNEIKHDSEGDVDGWTEVIYEKEVMGVGVMGISAG